MDKQFNIQEIPLQTVWEIRHRVMYPELDPIEVRLPDDEAGIHLGLELEGQILSVISLFDRGQELQFRKFATEPEYQGKGYGSTLLRHVIDYAMAGSWNLLWCNARASASAFYQRFGMEPFGESWQQYGIKFIKMKKQIG